MPELTIILEGDGAWPDLYSEKPAKDLIFLSNNAPAIQVAALDGGMVGGKPSIAIRIDLPDGKVVVAETSMRLFFEAAGAFWARYGRQF